MIEANTAFFSVVIPVYNRADVIHRALDSLVNQRFTDFEVIVVDDGSDDATALNEVISHYVRNLRINLIQQESNVNGAHARNKGLEAAKGEYVAFLDSDDCWQPDRLDVIARILRGHHEAESTIFYSRITRCATLDDDSAYDVPKESKGEESVSEYIFLRDGFIQTSTIVCSREIACGIGFDERYVRHQDYDFCLRAEAAGYSFSFVDYTCGWWIRGHDGQAMASVDFRLWWAEEMRKYMTEPAYYAYLIGLVMPRAVVERRWLIVVQLLGKCLLRAPNYVYINACRRSLSLLGRT